MGADHVVLLFILVWTFTSVCHDVISVICEDVTGTVGEEVTLTCSVFLSLECNKRCITGYRFQSPENYEESNMCQEWFPLDFCEPINSFTCRFTPTTAMTGQFRLFVETRCGLKKTEFTVNITEPSKHETDTTDPDPTGYGSLALITGAGVGCSTFIIFIIIMTILCVKRFRRNTPSGVQMKYERSASAEPTMTAINVQSETK